MPNPSCARCPQDRLHGLHTSRHIYTCVIPSNTHYEGVNSLALTFTQNYSHQNENAFHHFFHSSRRWIRRRCVSLRDHPPWDPVQEKTQNMRLTRRVNAHSQTPTDPNESSETVTATPTPPKEPGTGFFCQTSDLSTLDNSEGICNAAGGKFNLFSGVSPMPGSHIMLD